jgi:hypothetical protein
MAIPVKRRLPLVACLLHGAALAAEPPSTPSAPVPSFAQLEARGARIGTVTVESQNIFDLDDPSENNSLFRLANAVHVRTRPEVIRRLLLFKTGDPLTVQAIDETERIMRANHFIYDVVISPVSIHDGIVDIGITTRDTWSLDLTGRYARSGGTNTTAFGILDYNFLGTGTKLGLSQTSDVDRHGTEFIASYGQAFDGWTSLSYAQARYSDGDRASASVTRPFYSLDTRWAAGASWDRWNRIESIYNAGDTTAKYRHRSEIGEIFGAGRRGWCAGGRSASPPGRRCRIIRTKRSPAKQRLAAAARPLHARILLAPRGRRGQIREVAQPRPDLPAGILRDGLRVQRPGHSLARVSGASRSAWLYDASISKGFRLDWGDDLLASATLQRQIASTGNPSTGWAARCATSRHRRRGTRCTRRSPEIVSAMAPPRRTSCFSAATTVCVVIPCDTNRVTGAPCSRSRSALIPIGTSSGSCALVAPSSTIAGEHGAA